MLDARERWTRLESKRSALLERARDCAKLTIPALLPPVGHTDSSPLAQPYQSLGARGVNNLASKLLLAILPPGQSMFRLQPDAKVMASLGAQATEAQQALAQIEQQVTAKVESSAVRPVAFETLTHLVVTGNALFHKGPNGDRMYRLDQYGVSRDPSGNPVEVVIRETVSSAVIKPEVRDACGVVLDEKHTNVDVFTVVEWSGGKVKEWQEINGKLVPGSVGIRPIKRSRWLPLRWRAVPGSDYGRGHVEEYLGDLRSLEGLNMAIVQFAAAASKILFMVRPGSQTNIDEVFNKESGSAIAGLPDDVHVLQLEKFADFQVAKSVLDGIELRLSYAFLLRSGATRDAERVTAEEIRALAQELEDALGGTYTVLASEFQLPYVRLQLQEMQAAGELPTLPEGIVEPVIVTGFQALGRNHAVNRLRAWLADLAGVDPQFETVRKDKVGLRLGTGHGVEDLADLIKTADELAAERQQAQAMALAEKAAGPVMAQAAKAGSQQ
jgi:hypothetical protein